MARTEPTLEDVAARAAVSKATASKVFNGRTDVSAATRARVNTVAEELGYVSPRRAADGRQRQVWVVFDQMASHYAGHVLDGLLTESGAHDALVVVDHWRMAESKDALPGSAAWIRQGIAKGANAFVLITTPVGADHVRACASGNVPLMVVDPASQAPQEVLSVGATNWQGGVQATEHLIGLGHRRIAFVGALPSSKPGRERLAGYRSAMESASLAVDPRHLVLGHFRTEDGRACRDILSGRDRPTAVFAANDAVALGVLQAAHEVGLRVPDDLSVIGFDDSHAAAEATPPLTTVRQPLFDMGRMAMRSTMSVVRGDPRITPHIELATTLVERDSTAAAPRSTTATPPAPAEATAAGKGI